MDIQVVDAMFTDESCDEWLLHIYCNSKIIPVLHLDKNTAYAKSEILYLQQMTTKEFQTGVVHLKEYTTKVYWTIIDSNPF